MSSLKLTIIGGSGFIGTRLCDRLNKIGLDFKILDKIKSVKYPNKTIVADVRFLDSLISSIESNEIIINLAAEHRDDVYPKSLYNDVNVSGAKNICAIAEMRNLKTIIFTSSVAVYGFAPLGTDESGLFNAFNDYGKTKYEAELIYKKWQLKDPKNRTLAIIRPTVVFGERNRGNVYNLFKQILSGKFIMIGNGHNRKSMAYVENVAAFIEYCLTFKSGIHIYNYADKPDFTMNDLVSHIRKILGRSDKTRLRLPYFAGILIGRAFDLFALIMRKKFSISSIRIKKFCSNSVYESAVSSSGFIPPVDLVEGIKSTVRFEFLEDHRADKEVYFTE
jgi:nucleoside-diphosphate-sugar epimerase